MIELNQLAMMFCKAINRHGTIVFKHGNPMVSELQERIDRGTTSYVLYASSNARGNGRFDVRVTVDDRLVCHVLGSYMTRPYDLRAEVYEEGPWLEELVEMAK